MIGDKSPLPATSLSAEASARRMDVHPKLQRGRRFLHTRVH